MPCSDRNSKERALELHQKAIFINALDSTSMRNFNDEYTGKLKKVGINAINVTILGLAEGFRPNITRIRNWYDLVEKNSKKISLARSAHDIRKAKDDGKVAVIFGSQSSNAIEDDIGLLKILHALGIRIMGISYQRRNLLGDGADERTNSGLSKFGIQAIEEMNRLGIVIDGTHSGYTTVMDTIEFSKDPIIISHTCVRSLCDHIRNTTDDQIKALSEKGGVIGITPKSHYLKKQGKTYTGSSLEDYFSHIDYVAKLVGTDHVGLGFDIGEGRTKKEVEAFIEQYPDLFVPYDRELGYPGLQANGLQNISEVFNVTSGLVARGYSDQDIMKILGKNFLRVFERVWKKA